ncbi:uncharacterized protein TNCV_624691 [Trichonephila clavipes]|nr:uncharacterized protein TNCV_624691 [Trichonephila clavipes]
MVPDRELNSKGHYLAHQPVFKPDNVTTKIRPVFDVSCKIGALPSLNDCLVKGPNLIEEILSILLRFREKYIGVNSDIRRTFLQIELRQDRDFLRFFWWERDNVVKVFRHTRMTYGPVGEAVRSALNGLNAESTSENIVPVLEIMWDRKGDILYVEFKTVIASENLSKREFLSLTQATFDPLGFLTPSLLTAKLLLQKMWTCGVGWDTALTENIKRKFLKCYNGLEVLNERQACLSGEGEDQKWLIDSSGEWRCTYISLEPAPVSGRHVDSSGCWWFEADVCEIGTPTESNCISGVSAIMKWLQTSSEIMRSRISSRPRRWECPGNHKRTALFSKSQLN